MILEENKSFPKLIKQNERSSSILPGCKMNGIGLLQWKIRRSNYDNFYIRRDRELLTKPLFFVMGTWVGIAY